MLSWDICDIHTSKIILAAAQSNIMEKAKKWSKIEFVALSCVEHADGINNAK